MRLALLCLAGILIRNALAQFASIDWTLAGHGDAAVDWEAAKLFWAGISPYTPEGLAKVGVSAFGHPPTTPFWFLPWTDLSHQGFARALGVLNTILALGLVALAVFTLQLPAPYLLTGLVFGAIQSLPAALEQAQVIRISVWIALAYALAWRWMRQGRQGPAGIALGLACTLKLFPGLLVLYFLLTRRLRLVVAAVVTFKIQPSTVAYDRIFALFSVLSAYLNPWIWEHYFYLLVLPALIAAAAVRQDLNAVYQRWLTGEFSGRKLLLASIAALVGLLPLAVSWHTYSHTTKLTEGAYCGLPNASPAKAWMLSQVEHFELLNWLPWPLFLGLFLILLSYRPPGSLRGERGLIRTAKNLDLGEHQHGTPPSQ